MQGWSNFIDYRFRWERAIEKQEYISYPGEWDLEGVPVNVVGKLR